MNLRKILTGLFVSILLAAVAVGALAAPPLAVHIEAAETIGSSGEPFTATGPAVDAGLLCGSGTVDDLVVEVSGPPGGDFTILRVLKRFNCGDLSGSFDVRLIVYLDLITHETTASWNLVGGTGAYAGLHGNGSLTGTPIVPGTSILDVYDGKVH